MTTPDDLRELAGGFDFDEVVVTHKEAREVCAALRGAADRIEALEAEQALLREMVEDVTSPRTIMLTGDTVSFTRPSCDKCNGSGLIPNAMIDGVDMPQYRLCRECALLGEGTAPDEEKNR